MGQHYSELLYFEKQNVKSLIRDLQQSIPVEKELDFGIDFDSFEGDYPYYSGCAIWLKEDQFIVRMLAAELFFDVKEYSQKYSTDLVKYLSDLDTQPGISLVENLIKKADSSISKYVKERKIGEHREFYVEGFNIDLCFLEKFLCFEINAGWKRCNNIIAYSPMFKDFCISLLQKYSGIYAITDNDLGEELTFWWCRGEQIQDSIDLFEIIHLNEEDKLYYLKVAEMASLIEDS